MPFSILRKMDQDIRESSLKEYNNSKKENNKDKDKDNDNKKNTYCLEEFNQYQTCTDENPKQDCLDLFQIWIKCNEKPFSENK